MKILLAKDAGYCFGVRDAVSLAYETAEKEGEVFMLGDIVHNENVVEELEETGVKVVNSLDKVPDNKPILFRAHGTVPDVWKESKMREMEVVDYIKQELPPINVGQQFGSGLYNVSGKVKKSFPKTERL